VGSFNVLLAWLDVNFNGIDLILFMNEMIGPT
jgi:hypothetical protein